MQTLDGTDTRLLSAMARDPRRTVVALDQKLGPLAVELAGIPEILEGYGLTGSADLLLRVVALDAEDLFRINGKILACDGVDRTDTALAMGELIPFRIQPLLERGSADN